jgi:cell volume regulation protein A
MTVALGWPFAHGLLLGAVIGGTSSAIVIAMTEKAKVSSDTKARLTVESTITDALSIIVAIVVLKMIIESGGVSVGELANTMLGSFTIAIFLGVFSAISWIVLSHKFLLHKYRYMLTLALVFGLYALTEAINASGGIAVFTFGLILGNAKHFLNLIRIRIEKPIDPKVKVFQDEVTFFVRTFFFVYIGLLLSPSVFSGVVVLVSVALLGLVMIGRWATTRIILPGLPDLDFKVVISMMPRGLAAAVLATFPLSAGLNLPDFQQIVFALIVLSNIAATAGLFIFKKKESDKVEDELKQTLEEAKKEEEEAKKKVKKTKKEIVKVEKEIKQETKKEKKPEAKQ